MSIKLISFDVWSTLVKANKTYKGNRVALLAQAINVSNLATVKAAMDEADDLLDTRTIETGMQFGFAERVTETCALLGTPVSDTDRLYVAMSEAFLADLPTLTEQYLPMMLAALKGMRFKIAVISNTGFVTADLMRAVLTKLGLYESVDYGLFSDEIGAAKPSPQVFLHLAEVSGIAAAQTLHVGDNIDTDYNGALASGLRALLYAPQDEQPDVCINVLTTLPSHSALL